jgi:hypothetical protein
VVALPNPCHVSLHLDMNCSAPDFAALEQLLPKMYPIGIGS